LVLEDRLPLDSPNPGETTMRHYAVCWLANAFACFGLPGSLAGVVNLAFAMMGQEPKHQQSACEVVSVLKDFKAFLLKEEWSSLWVPTHMIHDSEIGGILAWLLVASIHVKRNTLLNRVARLGSSTLEGSFGFFEKNCQHLPSHP